MPVGSSSFLVNALNTATMMISPTTAPPTCSTVKPANSYALMEQPDIDGALVGGASLDPASFYAIIRFDLSPEEAAQ